jgi:DNA gyrase subunit A
MGLEQGDELVFARLAKEDDEVIMVSTQGKAIRFTVAELRSASRASGGVRGMRLQAQDDEIVGLEVVDNDAMLLTISETGLGKRTAFGEYTPHGRGGQGMATHNVTARTGRVVVARAVKEDQEIMLITVSGIVMRTTISSVLKVGRSAQGVHVMNPPAGDRIASVAIIDLTPRAEPPPGATTGQGANGNGRRARRSNGRRNGR